MNLELSKSNNHPGRRRGTPIPVAPPRIPTPMPTNNNNLPRSTSKDLDSKNHPSTAVSDIPKLITKSSYKVLDNDVKTAWINPRLLSKIDMEIIKKTDYVPPSERNMNGHYHSQHPYQKQQGCGRVHDREWEAPVNGRAKSRPAAPVPAPTSAAVDARRRSRPTPTTLTTTTKSKAQMEPHLGNRVANAKTKNKTPKAAPQRSAPCAPPPQPMKGVVGYHQSATACYVGGMPGTVNDSGGGVYGVYAETKYIYAVNGMPGNPAQASAAAAFFAR
ncbi:hypothetical protein NQ315_007583 [Exocentrus adspersus]|uniref:Uncharacterized protein n=1 Tax=Exocentrus adspersus TaxID=1586481 RepID=A0AAV8W7D0_9CUCU|nr:hypothetical protein NQ315_007583 [Exocentrus adspersus]